MSLDRAAVYLPYLSGGSFSSYNKTDPFAFRCVGHQSDIKEEDAVNSAPPKITCGLSGTLTERIKDCSTSMKRGGRGSHGKSFTWKLVTRSQAVHSAPGEQPEIYFPEVWLDIDSNALWSAPFNGLISFSYKPNHLQDRCDALRAENLHNYNLPNVRWSIPTKEQLEQAEPHGMQFVPTNMVEEWFWSSTIYEGDPGFAYGLGLGGISYNSLTNYGKLRCIAEL